jgi:hypothetical protein
VVLMEPPNDEDLTATRAQGLTLFGFKELEQIGATTGPVFDPARLKGNWLCAVSFCRKDSSRQHGAVKCICRRRRRYHLAGASTPVRRYHAIPPLTPPLPPHPLSLYPPPLTTATAATTAAAADDNG